MENKSWRKCQNFHEKGKKKMNVGLIFFISIIIFLISVLGLFLSRDIISIFITYQIMLISTIINFLNFSLNVSTDHLWDKVFLVLGFITIYLLIFAVFFYIYSNIGILERKEIVKDYRLFKLEKSDWWGEDNI